MSHMTAIEFEIDSIECLRTAATRRGLVLDAATEFKWYGAFMGDSAGLEGIPVEEWNKCSYKLRIADRSKLPPALQSYYQLDDAYEIGVVKQANGSYSLRLDTWGPGQMIAQLCGGDDLKALKDEYAYAVSEDYLLTEGYEVAREVDVDGSIVCVGRL